ncbi:MAG: hypothetical protein L0177_16735, partial [Chloroflexi bacterium]|nr:hypothetical protein [Chloroflexota bacterium]
DGYRGSSSDPRRSLSEWTELLDRREGAGTSELARYVSADVRGDPHVHERFIADVMAPAARALLSADGAWYQVALRDKRVSGYQTCRIVRVVIGLFQTGSMHRVTAYHVDPWNRTYVTTEQDGLFAKRRTAPWDGRSPVATRALQERAEAASHAASDWMASNVPTAGEARALAQWHTSQVEELKRLYDFFYPSSGRLARSRKSSETGYLAGRSGYVEKLEEQLRRMVPVYRTFLLSIGEIRASLPSKYNKDAAAFSL